MVDPWPIAIRALFGDQPVPDVAWPAARWPHRARRGSAGRRIRSTRWRLEPEPRTAIVDDRLARASPRRRAADGASRSCCARRAARHGRPRPASAVRRRHCGARRRRGLAGTLKPWAGPGHAARLAATLVDFGEGEEGQGGMCHHRSVRQPRRSGGVIDRLLGRRSLLR